ncbi:ribosome biogenesis GTPase Der [Granulosicoccaceae sp. 1_MG-2023]|nr:ribosome biogenesis GTPase Der [Granulosicoccaceae sp. 1_MG-2023]
MKPVIALVGRPNVGKSTLFNKLTRTMDALVADFPGLTRDRKYGAGKLGDFSYTVVDTGGLSGEEEGIDVHMAEQTRLAIDEADVVLFLVDGRDGLSTVDEDIAKHLRRSEKKVSLVVNKIDGVGEEQASAEFYALGMGEPLCIAASHNRGLTRMLEALQARYGFDDDEAAAAASREQDGRIRVGIIGRPNVGKSTLINRLTGEARVVAFDQPGTTRDTVEIPFRRGKRDYLLVDTAGVRRRGKIAEVVEKFSVIKTLKAIEESHVCVLMVDATEGVTDQDLSLTGYAMEKGRAIVLAINKWDELEPAQRDHVKVELERRTAFLSFTKTHFISALTGSGVDQLFRSISRAFDSATLDMSTPVLTRMLEHAVSVHQPPMINGRRIRLRYAHQGGSNPPVIVIHGNQVERVPASYKRYLMNFYQKELGLFGTPVRISFSGKENPFENRREKLTPLQKYKKQKEEKRRGPKPGKR